MFKNDKAVCFLCNQLLVDTVIIPCGNSICKKHIPLELFLESSNSPERTFKCGVCLVDHFVPNEGFVTEHMQYVLDKFEHKVPRDILIEAHNVLAKLEEE